VTGIIPIKKPGFPVANDILTRLEKLEDCFLASLQEIRAIKVEIRAREDSAASLEQLLDVKQVAELLGETEQWVYRKAQTKKMPSIKMGKYWKFSPSQLQKWLERKQTP